MNNPPESILNLLFSGLMGIFGGLITIPFNAIATWWLKRDEQLLKHRLDWAIKRQELLLQHKLELEKNFRENELLELKSAILKLEEKIK